MERHKTIVIGNKQSHTNFEAQSPQRDFFYTLFENKAYLFHLKNADVDSYVIFTQNLLQGNVERIIENIHYLNSFIKILVCHSETWSLDKIKQYKEILVVKDESEISASLNELQEDRRKFHRVKWPVTVKFWPKSRPYEQYKGIILSLSAGGCFIPTDAALEQGENIEMLVAFKDFDFYSEGLIVRVIVSSNHLRGIALQFKDISLQTKDCIDKIIGERILGDLMKTIGPEKAQVK